ncbi:gametocyte-specific factor 1 homolog [Cylas formicarius]|uniref:gametocyte-specific factor 1 homolog n=1 Tax=Cylas formicarius TaxID=197179 RepID=UPI002958A2FA|nr:gametocyte-specific factor 1 homolog [Cylas formicarius]
MDILRNLEEKILCPYNSAHYIRKMRMEAHLIKCRKSYEQESRVLVACDFNTCHLIPQPELQYHHDTCPDRKKVEFSIITEATAPIMPVQSSSVPVDDSWDDCDLPSYNPAEYCEKNNILRRVDAQSAAKRKDFRLTERQRLERILSQQNTSDANVKVSTSSQPKKEVLPPIPNFSTTVEPVPDNISKMLSAIKIVPSHAKIAKK